MVGRSDRSRVAGEGHGVGDVNSGDVEVRCEWSELRGNDGSGEKRSKANCRYLFVVYKVKSMEVTCQSCPEVYLLLPSLRRSIGQRGKALINFLEEVFTLTGGFNVSVTVRQDV